MRDSPWPFDVCYMMLCADASAVCTRGGGEPPPYCQCRKLSSCKVRRRRQYQRYGQAAQRSMAEIYQLAFLTPGIWPL